MQPWTEVASVLMNLSVFCSYVIVKLPGRLAVKSSYSNIVQAPFYRLLR